MKGLREVIPQTGYFYFYDVTRCYPCMQTRTGLQVLKERKNQLIVLAYLPVEVYYCEFYKRKMNGRD